MTEAGTKGAAPSMVERMHAAFKAKIEEQLATDPLGRPMSNDELEILGMRAALGAMREPTGSMEVAGSHVHDQRPSEVGRVFSAMIDEALSQGAHAPVPTNEGEQT